MKSAHLCNVKLGARIPYDGRTFMTVSKIARLMHTTELSLVISTSHFEVTGRIFWTYLVITNPGQTTRTAPDLATTFLSFRTTPAGGNLTQDVRFNVQQAQNTAEI
ncbi:hypothetical protein AVEN_145121-1 [Araneus ventricosus]|uniref:Uncharacterized protein n=1 Tax=Araneus ventricosus TaxID=182803 RepID=A0A4Y2JFA9_ARAVE|nr:hypothetical protein AVEN_145121-1 [Araneus ventricosus]